MGIRAEAQGLVPHTEDVEIMGKVSVWLRDLEIAWHEAESRNPAEVTAEAAYRTLSFEFDAPRAIVWDYLTSPARRPLWVKGVTEVREATKDSRRRGAGTTDHCMHGKDAQIEEILDWRPHEQTTVRLTFPDPRLPPIVVTDVLTDLPGERTRLESRLGRPKPEDVPVLEAAFPMMLKDREASFAALKRLVAEEASRQITNREAAPDLPESSGRFISEPVRRHADHGHTH